MSLLPILKKLMAIRQPAIAALYDQHLTFRYLNDYILRPTTTVLVNPLSSSYFGSWRKLTFNESGLSSIQADKNGLKISLNVQQFKPEELKVTVSDGYIVIDGKHEEHSDEHGFVSHQLTQRYKIPRNVDPAALVSSLSSDGVLTLKAPIKALPEEENYREIPITYTNQPTNAKSTP